MQEEPNKIKKPTSREPNECKYIQVTDPVTKKTIFEICKTPDEGSHYTFWYRPTTGDSGLTIKSIAKSAKGKSNSSDVIWKCTWVYNEEKNIYYSALASRNLLKEEKIVDGDADSLKAIYDVYRKA